MNYSRRDFIKSMAATGAALSLAGFAKAESELPIGIQLYTVRDKSGQDFQGTLKKVADIGYKYFEFAGYGDMDAGALNAFLEEIGAKTCGSHEAYEKFLDNADAVIEFNQAIGNPYITIPFMAERLRKSADQVKRVAENLNLFGYKVKQAGMQLCYHNHSFEFEKIDGDQTVWDVLFSVADADMVKAEVDVAWVYNAGIDPVAFLEKWGDRVKLLHMKDLNKDKQLCPVGEGEIDLKTVADVGKKIGVEYFIVEQDRTRKGKDIMDEIALSYKNLVKILS